MLHGLPSCIFTSCSSNTDLPYVEAQTSDTYVAPESHIRLDNADFMCCKRIHYYCEDLASNNIHRRVAILLVLHRSGISSASQVSTCIQPSSEGSSRRSYSIVLEHHAENGTHHDSSFMQPTVQYLQQYGRRVPNHKRRIGLDLAVNPKDLR